MQRAKDIPQTSWLGWETTTCMYMLIFQNYLATEAVFLQQCVSANSGPRVFFQFDNEHCGHYLLGLLSRQGKGDTHKVYKTTKGAQHCTWTPTYVFHPCLVLHLIYTYTSIFGDVWPVLCRCTLKPTKTNKLYTQATTVARRHTEQTLVPDLLSPLSI